MTTKVEDTIPENSKTYGLAKDGLVMEFKISLL